MTMSNEYEVMNKSNDMTIHGLNKFNDEAEQSHSHPWFGSSNSDAVRVKLHILERRCAEVR